MPSWNTNFLQSPADANDVTKRALIILNQPFSAALLLCLWNSARWHACADGGANWLYDLFTSSNLEKDGILREQYLPDLIKGDLDSLRSDVHDYYSSKGVPVISDGSMYATDLMKCVEELEKKEAAEQSGQYDIVILGGLSGRLDQTIHTLSYLHKLRKSRKRVFAVTDDNVGWVLDAGEHTIQIDHGILGQTCGLLPVGIDSTILTTKGLRWNLTDHPSGFDGMVSTSNHFVPGQDVWIKTSKPIWWTAELKNIK